MSRICLLCNDNKTPEDYRICQTCFNLGGNYLEQNVEKINVFPHLLKACREAYSAVRIIREFFGGKEPSNTEILLQEAIRRAA
jgi:hypothetical protein